MQLECSWFEWFQKPGELLQAQFIVEGLPDGTEFSRIGRMNGWQKSDDLTRDAMIAATACVHRLTVVPRNTKDFRHFSVQTFDPFHYRS